MTKTDEPPRRFVPANLKQEAGLRSGSNDRTVFRSDGLRSWDPFVLCHHFISQPGEEVAFSEMHGHKGFEGLSILLKGSLHHKDMLGNEEVLRAGEAQCFTAGKSYVHQESPGKKGAEGIQVWVNLPRAEKKVDPSYQRVSAHELGCADGIVPWVGERSPVSLYTPARLETVNLKARSERELKIASEMRGLVYCLRGKCEVNGDSLITGWTLFFDVGVRLNMRGGDIDSDLFLAFAEPQRQAVKKRGPFVY